MTGKELLLLLAGTGVAAGAGGVGAAVVLDDGGRNEGADAEVLELLDEVRGSLEQTRESVDEQSTELRRMGRRIQQFEIDLAETGKKLANGTLVAESAADDRHAAVRDLLARGATTGRIETLVDGGVLDVEIETEAIEAAQKALADALESVEAQIETTLPQIELAGGELDSLRMSLGGLSKGLELRKLPEEERWDKAREEVGLNDVQIDEIKAAIAERDAAMEEAMKPAREETDTDGSPLLRIRNLDFAKARDANERYRKRVDNTLNDQQKKDWKDKGYDTAFGNSGLGMTTGTVISVSSFSGSESSEDGEK